ncbi:MAG: Peptidase M56, BlaR1, partial [Clostridium butyricum DORA_1]
YLSEKKHDLSMNPDLMNIYDREDLHQSEEILGFRPSIPRSINGVEIIDSMVGLTSDSDVENNKINYMVSNTYRNNKNIICIVQSKHDIHLY